ncbi:hypothetical protein FB567DRAFT_581698 [Paraphoma chrysanthemicola]|uniref:Uncharacterized protein n=1 Tax=Paraphoma chrysanthemicola TaxID=798071 RepID=A0A8K0R3L3_9PLEO|nr:hypothetical protein FB567DRAFT_581698 [Paraphoma chrysanthemicola]
MAPTSKRAAGGNALWQRQVQGMNSIMRQIQVNNPPRNARPTGVSKNAGTAPHRDNIAHLITRQERNTGLRQARMRPDSPIDLAPKAPHQDYSRDTPKRAETAVTAGGTPLASPTRDGRQTLNATLNGENISHISRTRKRASTEEIDRVEVKKPRLSQSDTAQRGQATSTRIPKPSEKVPVNTSCKSKRPAGTTGEAGGNSSQQQACDTFAGAKTPVSQREPGKVACLISPASSSSPQATSDQAVVTKSTLEAKVTKIAPQQKLRQNSTHPFAPIHPSANVKHEYAPYDDKSIPIMRSTIIKHRKDVLPTSPSTELRGRALVLLERGFKAKDLGRPDVTKRGPTLDINDCDLYLRGKEVHVACELGTLLVATYLKLRGIPDETPVRFNGAKPAWAQASVPQRHLRRVQNPTKYDNPFYVLKPWDPPEAKPLLEPLKIGQLALDASSLVQVFVRDSKGMCYGRRLDKKDRSHIEDKRCEGDEDDDEGWFHYGITVGLNEHYQGGGEGAFKPRKFDETPPALQSCLNKAKAPKHLHTLTTPTRVQSATSPATAAIKQSALSQPPDKPACVEQGGLKEESSKEINGPSKTAKVESIEDAKEEPKDGLQARAIQADDQLESEPGKAMKEELKDEETNTNLKEHIGSERDCEFAQERADKTGLLPIQRASVPSPPPYGSIEDEVDWDDDEL